MLNIFISPCQVLNEIFKTIYFPTGIKEVSPLGMRLNKKGSVFKLLNKSFSSPVPPELIATSVTASITASNDVSVSWKVRPFNNIKWIRHRETIYYIRTQYSRTCSVGIVTKT